MPLPRPNVRKPPVQRAAAAAAAAAKVRFRPGSEPDGREKVFTERTYCEATNLPFRTTQIILEEDLRVSGGAIIPLIALCERLLTNDKLSRFRSGS